MVVRISAGVLVGALIVLAVSLYVSGRLIEEQQRLAAAGDFDGATERVNLAARLDPFDPQPLEEEALILQRQGQNQQAEDVLEEAIRRNPREYTPRISLAYLQMSRLNDYAAAEETYREALEYNPNFILARNGLAQALLKQGDLEEAKRQYEILREAERISARGLFDLGRLYIRTGEPEKGVQVLEAARRRATSGLSASDGLSALDPEEREEFVESVELAIADALVVQGRYAEAREIVAESPSEQAPAILELLDSDPDLYRQSVLDSEIY